MMMMMMMMTMTMTMTMTTTMMKGMFCFRIQFSLGGSSAGKKLEFVF